MPLLRQTFPVGALGCNCTIVSCPDTKRGAGHRPRRRGARDPGRAGRRRPARGQDRPHPRPLRSRDGDRRRRGAHGRRRAAAQDDRWLYDNAIMQTQMFGLARPGDRAAARRPPTSWRATRRSASAAARSARCTRPDTRRARSASTSRRRGGRRCCSRATPCSRGRSGARTCGAARCRPSRAPSAIGC